MPKNYAIQLQPKARRILIHALAALFRAHHLSTLLG